MPLSTILSTVQLQLNLYFCPICLTLGIVGCLLNVFLFSQKEFRTISCCIYFLVASIAMIGTLCFGFIPNAYAAYHPNPVNTINIFCKIRGYAAQSSSMIYRWLIVMACIDRYMSSSSSIRLQGFANSRIAYRIVIINVIIWLILPVHNLIFLEIWGGLCGFPLVIVLIYHSIFTIMLGSLLPLLIMIVCALLIRFNLASKRERRQHNIGQQNKQQAVRLLHARDHQALLMLFFQSICFCLSAMPWTIYLLYNSFTRQVTNKSTDRIAIELFLRYLTEIITYIYPTLSFYIYTLTSYTFRRQLIKTIHFILTYRNRRAVHPRRIMANLENA